MSKTASSLLDEDAAKAGYIATELETRGAAFLKAANVSFRGFQYVEELNVVAPTQQSADSTTVVPKTRAITDRLGISENSVVKTLVFFNTETKQPFIILMHGDCLVNTKKLAKAIGAPRVASCPVEIAQQHSGYQVGGTSPFGLANMMPVYVQESILDLDCIIINGGSKSAYVLMNPKDIVAAFESEHAKGLGYPSVRKVDCKQLRKVVDDNQQPPAGPSSSNNSGNTSQGNQPQTSAKSECTAVAEDKDGRQRKLSSSHRHLDMRMKQLQEVESLRLMFPLNNLEDSHDPLDLDMTFESTQVINNLRQVIENRPEHYGSVSALTQEFDQALIKVGEINVSFPLLYPVDETETQPVTLNVSLPVAYPHDPARAWVSVSGEWCSVDLAGLSSALNRYTQTLALTQSNAVFACRDYVFDHSAKFSLKKKPVEAAEETDDIHQSLVNKIRTRAVAPQERFIEMSSPCVAVNTLAGEPISLLGKPKGHIKIGLVGLPNVGKSSLFNLVSGMQVPAENYAFCTINPNVATVPIMDTRYKTLLQAYKPTRHQPGVVSIVDIAGLVKGASKGLGLGNAFLHHISTVQVIYQVIRVFPDKHVEHVEGNVDPIRDINIINKELVEKDLEQMFKRIQRINRPKVNQWAPMLANKENHELSILLKAHEWLLSGQPLRLCQWTQAEIAYLSTLQMWTSKPVCYLLNMSAVQYAVPKLREEAMAPVKAWLDLHSPDCAIVPVSVSYEQAAKRCPEDAEPWFIAAVAVKLNERNTRNDADMVGQAEKDKQSSQTDKNSEKKDKKEKKSSKKDDVKHKKEDKNEKEKSGSGMRSANKDGKKDKKDKKAFAADLDFSGGFSSFLDEPVSSVSAPVISMPATVVPEVVFPTAERHPRSRSSSTTTHKPPTSRENSEIRKLRLPAEFLAKLEDPALAAQVDACAFGKRVATEEEQNMDVDDTDEAGFGEKHIADDDPEGHVEAEATRGKSLNLSEKSALFKMIQVGYTMARLKQFYVCYPQLVKGIMVPDGCKAPSAAARLSYELEESFVSCEVCNYKDWFDAGRNMAEARNRGTVKTQGKNYEIVDGDILLFKGVNKAKLFEQTSTQRK